MYRRIMVACALPFFSNVVLKFLYLFREGVQKTLIYQGFAGFRRVILTHTFCVEAVSFQLDFV